jgi:CRISPR-associated endoribonuclease Cas6
MQITVKLIKDKITLPIASCEMVQGLIYKALSEDPEYSESVHENGRRFDGRKFKLFTFADLKGKYETGNGIIVYFSDVELTVRSSDSYIIQLLFSYFNKNEYVRLGNNSVAVGEVRLEDAHIFEDRVTVRTLSPITVYRTDANGHTVYFSPNDEHFCDAIVSNARRKWASRFGSEEGFSLRVATFEGARYIKRATRFKTTFITAWHGRFILEGPPRVLDFLYRTGLGSKNSQGFGMFEIV